MDAPIIGGVTDAPNDHKTTLNIDIYPSTLVFVENIGPKYDFEGGWGGLWYGILGGGPDPKKKSFNRILCYVFLEH